MRHPGWTLAGRVHPVGVLAFKTGKEKSMNLKRSSMRFWKTDTISKSDDFCIGLRGDGEEIKRLLTAG